MQVVGEASYQPALQRVTGSSRWEKVRHECVAVLVREPENPYDSNAVMVTIDGHGVGYLSRGDALEYGPVLSAVEEVFGALVGCDAVISGRGPGAETPNMGVFLSLPDPGEELASDLALACEEQGIQPLR